MSQEVYLYKWNYCAGTVDISPCESPPVAWFSVFGGTCVVVGMPGSQTVELIDISNPKAGIAISYFGYLTCVDNIGFMGFRLETECDPDQEFLPYDLVPYTAEQCTSIIRAKSKYGCPSISGGGIFNGEIGGLSLGSVICIIFAVIVFVYFAAGIVYNIRWKHKTGLDVIPNRERWRDFGILAWTGTKWTFGKIRSRIGGSSSSSSSSKTTTPYSQL